MDEYHTYWDTDKAKAEQIIRDGLKQYPGNDVLLNCLINVISELGKTEEVITIAKALAAEGAKVVTNNRTPVKNGSVVMLSPEKLAKRAVSILSKKTPKFNYAINRNPLLLMLDILPKGLRFFIIRQILKK